MFNKQFEHFKIGAEFNVEIILMGKLFGKTEVESNEKYISKKTKELVYEKSPTFALLLEK